MKYRLYELGAQLGWLDQRHIRLISVMVCVALFLLGAGAPGTAGDVNG
jgi:hypothetical protein